MRTTPERAKAIKKLKSETEKKKYCNAIYTPKALIAPCREWNTIVDGLIGDKLCFNKDNLELMLLYSTVANYFRATFTSLALTA